MAWLRTRERYWHPGVTHPDFDHCPRCDLRFGEYFGGGRRVLDMWLEESLGDGWLAAVRLVVQDGTPVASELRVFPEEPGRIDGGEWSAERFGHEAQVPAGGLTSRKLREVKIYQYLSELLPEVMARWTRLMRYGMAEPSTSDDDLPSTLPGLPAAAHRGPRVRSRSAGVSDTELARIAAEYVSYCQDPATSRSPRKALAERMGLDPARVRDLIFAARERRLLAGGRQGRPGGTLTTTAIELLRASEEES
jgi:hypothetical protein